MIQLRFSLIFPYGHVLSDMNLYSIFQAWINPAKIFSFVCICNLYPCIQSPLQLKGRQLLSVNFEDLQLWLMCSHTYSNHIYVSFARVSQAESLPVEDNSVDLITVGMALHWFDHPKFYKEVSYLKFYWHFCHFSKKRFPYTKRKK